LINQFDKSTKNQAPKVVGERTNSVLDSYFTIHTNQGWLIRPIAKAFNIGAQTLYNAKSQAHQALS
jgi:hypothetical protein